MADKYKKSAPKKDESFIQGKEKKLKGITIDLTTHDIQIKQEENE